MHLLLDILGKEDIFESSSFPCDIICHRLYFVHEPTFAIYSCCSCSWKQIALSPHLRNTFDEYMMYVWSDSIGLGIVAIL